ncbi:MAG TPA: alpha/beta hydrolase [Pyrinomonadaceae bacterium]|jgi:pimeloyl-ACP methyl ester carboxylesterase
MSEIQFDYAQIGGVRLHYAKAGEGERLVVLLHGFPEFWYSWRHQLAALGDEFTVVAPDLRGYNWSDKPPYISNYKIENSVDDVLGLIRHFGRERAAIVGHDWGAAIGWAIGENHPESVSKLVCLQVPPPSVWLKNLSWRQALASSYMLFFQIPVLPEWLVSRDDYALLARSMKRLTTDASIFSDEDLARYKESWSEPGALTAAINYYRANLADKILPGRVGEGIKVPTLFIYGEKDPAILPETVRNVKAAIDARYEEMRVPDAGHFVHQEAAEAVNDTLREFLSGSET